MRAEPSRTYEERSLVDSWAAMGLASRTIEQYLGVVRHASAWCDERGYKLRSVPAMAVRELGESFPLTHSSRRRLRSALDAYWEAIERPQAPVKAIRVPSKPQMRCRALEEPEARLLARTALARADRKGLVVLIGLYLGLRRAEIARLRWADFEEDGELTWVTLVGKGDVTATLPVHPVLASVLQTVPRGSSGWLFPGRFDGPVVPATIWEWIKQVGKEAELGPIPAHVLRHTCLTVANDATGDLRAVQMFARHARPDTTAGYTRVNTKRMLHVMLSLDYRTGEDAAC